DSTPIGEGVTPTSEPPAGDGRRPIRSIPAAENALGVCDFAQIASHSSEPAESAVSGRVGCVSGVLSAVGGCLAWDRAVHGGAGDGEQCGEFADGVAAGAVQLHQVVLLAGGELGWLAA